MATVLLVFDEKLWDYFIEWIRALQSRKWDAKAPLFPQSKLVHGENSALFVRAIDVMPEYWSGENCVRDIFVKRAVSANLPYYSPHAFKHFAIAQALQYCKNGEEIKAISQNFGHEDVGTTLRVYGNYQPEQLSYILRRMKFFGEPLKSLDEKMDEILRQMKQTKPFSDPDGEPAVK